MTRLAHVFAHAVVRRIAYVLVAVVLAWCGIGRANAQATYCGLPTTSDAVNATGPGVTYPTREAAQAACNSFTSSASPTGGGWFARMKKQACTLNPTTKDFTLSLSMEYSATTDNCGTTYTGSYSETFNGWGFSGEICPEGSTWDTNTQQCFNSDACKAKPALGPTFTSGSMSPTVCVDGCQFDAGLKGVCLGTDSGSECTVSGAKPTGQACGVSDKPPITEKPQQCTPDGKVCIKPDGQHCIAAASGRQICWQPGETGTKDDGTVKQKRDAGTEPIPPNLQLPSGDNLAPSGPKVQTTTTTNNTTITTVTQNYQTQNGTNAGGKNQGESGTGDGTGKEGDEDGEGSASGGENCESAPIVSGDPVMGMVATQAWATRCAVEAGNAAKVTGDIGNCSQPFTVEGTNANAHQLRAMRAQLCPQGTGPDPADYSGEPGDPSSLFGEGHEIGADGLDMSGLGFGESCPSIPTVSVMGRTIAFDTSIFCDWMQLGGVFVRIVAALWCLRVIGGA